MPVISVLKYTMNRGEPWERLVIVKNRRTRRILKFDEARCMAKFPAVGSSPAVTYTLPVTITNESGIKLTLDPDQTLDFPTGTIPFDIAAPIDGYWQIVAKGQIEVSDLGNITPLKDTQVMEIRFKKGEDVYRTFLWNDSEGTKLTVTDAYMQAKNSTGTTVVDLRWFPTAPSEATILGLPAEQRGYLAPDATDSVAMHISDSNSVAAGTYDYDMFVKGSGGDWVFLVGGQLVVEPSVSTRPS